MHSYGSWFTGTGNAILRGETPQIWSIKSKPDTGEDEDGGLHPVTLDLIPVAQGRADVLGDAGFTDLCRPVGQITGNGEALVTSDKSTRRKQ